MTSTVTTASRKTTGWAWYALVWVPIALFHAMNVASTTATISIGQALVAGFMYVIPVAVLGVAVWRLTGVIEWPPRSSPRFVAVHWVAAVTLSTIWLAVV